MWNVLYVEDNADARELVKIVFKRDKDEIKIQCAKTIEDAVESIRSRRPDLYLLDFHLPDGDGPELCKWIREFDKYKPIVFITANAYEKDKWEAVKAGCDVFLTKPLDLFELRREVMALLERHSPQRAH